MKNFNIINNESEIVKMNIKRIWKDHSRIKLRFNKHYLQVCADHHRQDDYEKFTYIDLYCGSPQAHFQNGDIEEGSALIALKKKVKCIFNDLDPDIYKEIRLLKKKYKNQILEVYNYDTNENVEKILEMVVPYYHSLFNIDPDKSSDLKWATVEKVINHDHTYADGTLRRPEILLNFPYYSISKICGFIDKDENQYKYNTDFFGNDKWIAAWKSGTNPVERRENLFNLYIENFRPYYKHLYSYLVESLNGNPLYYIIFLSIYPKIDRILTKLVENINTWMKEDFIREYKYKINCPIDMFCKSESEKIVKQTLEKIKRKTHKIIDNKEKKSSKSKIKTSQSSNLNNFI
jgi:three-Cys-motif partner protein